jgi:hypothetical protein
MAMDILNRLCGASVFLAAILLGFSAFAADQQLPAKSHDGLELVKSNRHEAIYMKPGVNLSQYNRVAILDCYVAFKKHWEQEQNENRVGLDRVNKKDMDRIKKDLAAAFKKVFTKELENNGGYTVVDTGAEDVLLLRPAIIDLDITAPDTMSPGMSETFTADPGQMTLYMELYDSATSAIIGRVTDTEEERNMGTFQVSNRATNMADADILLRRWADTLRRKLDAAHNKPDK